MCIGIYNYQLHSHNYVPSNWPSFCMAAIYNNLSLQGIITAYLSCSKQGGSRNSRGEGPKLNMCKRENVTLGHAHFGVLRGMPKWEVKS